MLLDERLCGRQRDAVSSSGGRSADRPTPYVRLSLKPGRWQVPLAAFGTSGGWSLTAPAPNRPRSQQ